MNYMEIYEIPHDHRNKIVREHEISGFTLRNTSAGHTMRTLIGLGFGEWAVTYIVRVHNKSAWLFYQIKEENLMLEAKAIILTKEEIDWLADEADYRIGQMKEVVFHDGKYMDEETLKELQDEILMAERAYDKLRDAYQEILKEEMKK